MKGGFRYGTTVKKYSRNPIKIKISQKSSRKRTLAGRTKRMRRKSRLSKYKKYLHRRSKRNKKTRRYRQCGGSQPLQFSYINNLENQVLPPRLPEGPHFNTVQGYGANLSNPPISGVTPVTQCTDM
jgi:hypothetical protein